MPSNRLFFPTMVQRHLNNSTNSTETYNDPFSTASTLQTDYMMDEPSIQNSFNSIIASVHQNLREIRLAKVNKAREAREAEQKNQSLKEETPTHVTGDRKLKKNLAKSELNLQTLNKNHSQGVGLFGKLAQYNTRSISQIKASCEQKFQQRMRRSIGRPTEINNFTNQQRLVEVLRQKRILEDILYEHDKIQRDRSTIAHEIETMKDYLNEIRGKLDSSLKKLNKKKTIVDSLPRPRKIPNRQMQNNKKNTSKIISKPGKQQSQRVSIERGLLK